MKTSKNKYRVIPYKGFRYVGGGSYGSYYKISPRRGIKIFCYCEVNKEDLLNSSYFSEIKREFRLLQRAEKVKLSPRPYEIVIVKDAQEYYAGIIMQHLNRFKKAGYAGWEIEEKLRNKLEKVGIDHGDLHDGNIIPVKRGDRVRWFAVDFSPMYITINTRKLNRYLKNK